MNDINQVVICDYAYYLARYYPEQLFAILRYNKQFNNCFADAVLRMYTSNTRVNNIHMYSYAGKYKFITGMNNIKQLNVSISTVKHELFQSFKINVNEVPKSPSIDTWNMFSAYEKSDILSYAAMYNIVDLFKQIGSNEVSSEEGYMFKNGALLIIAVYYNSIDVIKYILNDIDEESYFYDEYVNDDVHINLYQYILISKTEIENNRYLENCNVNPEISYYNMNVLKYVAYLGQLDIYKILITNNGTYTLLPSMEDDNYDEEYDDQYFYFSDMWNSGLIYAAANENNDNIPMINYLLDNSAQIQYEEEMEDIINDNLEHLIKMFDYMIQYATYHKLAYYNNGATLEQFKEDYLSQI